MNRAERMLGISTLEYQIVLFLATFLNETRALLRSCHSELSSVRPADGHDCSEIDKNFTYYQGDHCKNMRQTDFKRNHLSASILLIRVLKYGRSSYTVCLMAFFHCRNQILFVLCISIIGST